MPVFQVDSASYSYLNITSLNHFASFPNVDEIIQPKEMGNVMNTLEQRISDFESVATYEGGKQ